VRAAQALTRQWQSRIRSREEISNRFLRLRRSLTHAGFPHQTVYDLEWLVEILCARANAYLICPAGSSPSVALLSASSAQRERARFLYEIYCSSSARRMLSFLVLPAASPVSFHEMLWHTLPAEWWRSAGVFYHQTHMLL
jgi:hypothetical protein